MAQHDCRRRFGTWEGAIMTPENKTPRLRIVAGTERPAEGTESNAAKIEAVRTRSRNFDGKPRKVRSDAGIPKKRGRPRGVYHKPVAPSADEIEAKRARAYADMEPLLCDCVKTGRIADQLFDNPDRELYDFVVHRLVQMLEDLKAGYDADCFES
jgi:hypothetical protein